MFPDKSSIEMKNKVILLTQIMVSLYRQETAIFVT